MKYIALTAILILGLANTVSATTIGYARSAGTEFFNGYVMGMAMGFIAGRVLVCPHPVSGMMVLSVLDSGNNRYEDDKVEIAVFKALEQLSCTPTKDPS